MCSVSDHKSDGRRTLFVQAEITESGSVNNFV